jgi:hypothetical protein
MSALLTGCHSSKDAHIYESTPMLPMTVTVVDSTTGESLWALDVPVNRKLKIRFYDDRKPDEASGNRTAMMRWDLTSTDKSSGKLSNEIAVPLSHSRRIDVTLRDIPEFETSGGFVAPTTPADPPPMGSGNMLPSEMAPAESKDSPPELDPIEIPSGSGG